MTRDKFIRLIDTFEGFASEHSINWAAPTKQARISILAEFDRLTAEVERLKAENEQIVALSVLTNEKVAHIKTINAQLLDALLRYPEWDFTGVSWAGEKFISQRYCPCCCATDEHADDCLRQAAIRAAEEYQNRSK